MRVWCHPDGEPLAQALEEALARRQAGDPLAPIWIVTPTRRLRRHLQRRLAAGRARLGLSFFDPLALTETLAQRLGVVAAPRLTAVAGAVLLRQALEELPQGRELLAFRGAATALQPAIRDLREAGFGAPELGEPRPDGSHLRHLAAETQLLLEVFRRYRLAMLAAGLQDDFDRVARVRAALDDGRITLPPILWFGFSELVGRWRRLLRSLVRRSEIELFVPAGPEPDFAAAERLLQALPAAMRTDLPAPRAAVPRAGARSLRGPAAELEEALRQAYAWHAQGLALEDMALVARSLADYAPQLGALLPRWKLDGRLDSPAAQPLRLDPAAAVLRDGFRAFADAAPLAAALGAAAGRPAVEQALRRAWAEAEDASRRWPHLHQAELLAEAVDAAVVRPYERADGAGLSLLDFQQARGLSFRRVVLLGLHHGATPRPAREDSLLADPARERLSHGLPDALATSADQRADEHLLLALALRTAREELLVLRQHADAGGAALAESPAQRALEHFLGRELHFAPVSSDPLAAAARLVAEGSAPPEDACLALAAGSGPPGAALAELAAASAPVAELLGPAPAWIETVDSFAPRDLRHDGLLGQAAAGALEPLSVSRLEDYGRCPLASLFEHVLRVPPRGEAPSPGPRADQLGMAIHRLLQESALDPIEQALARFETIVAPLFASERTEERAYLAHACARWRDGVRRFLEWDRRRLTEGWNPKDANLGGGPMQIDPTFLEHPLEAELELAGQRVLLRGTPDRLLRAPGRVRISDYKTGDVSNASGATAFLRGASLQNALYLLLLERHPAAAGSAASAEAVRVHPDCDYAAKTAHVGGFGSGISEQKWTATRAGIVETAGVLLAHCRAGHFPPFRTGKKRSWDRWFNTMRSGHGPTEQRVANYSGWEELYRLSRKSARKKGGAGPYLLLAEVPASAAEEDDGE